MAIIFNGSTQGTQMPMFNIEEMVKDIIGSMIVDRMSLRSMGMIRYVEFFPIFTMCEEINEKSMSSIILKLKYGKAFTRIPVNEIELSGASLVEFIDFLYEKGAKEITAPRGVLELI